MTMNNLRLRKFMASLSLLATAGLFAVPGAFGQDAAPVTTTTTTTTTTSDAPKKDDVVIGEKYTVTGSFIPQATAEPIAPVAIFSEADIRATGATTVIQALRSLPSFVSSGANSNENDSNGGSGASFVSLRGQGAAQTLVLLDGRPAGNQTNIQMLPIEAIDRIEVLRDGAGIIYGSGAIGGAVNVILKKNYTGLEFNATVGGATRSPGSRDTTTFSFVGGASNDKTSVVTSGSYFKNTTLYAGQRPNSAQADNRRFGGTNGGSPTFAGNIQTVATGYVPFVLKPGFTGTPTSIADYVTMDQNAFSSNQLFNFRQYSPSAPGQKRQSMYANIEHKIDGKSLEIFGTFLYSQLTSKNGLAPAPFALFADGALGPAIGDITHWGPYNTLNGTAMLAENDTDFIRYRSVEIGNRTNEQVYNDFKYIVGFRGEVGDSGWSWEASYTLDNEQYRQLDAGVPSLPLLDAEVAAGRFNPFAQAFSTGSAVVGGTTFNWDNAKALKASETHARQLTDSVSQTYNVRVVGTVVDLPAGAVGIAAGYDYSSGNSTFDADSLYASGSVLGLNAFATHDYNEAESHSIFAEIKVPLLSSKNNIAFVHDLSIGALARQETQTVRGTNGLTGKFDSRKFDKINPSVNLQYSPTEDYKLRATWSKGFLAPSSGAVFSVAGTSNPTIADPLGFPTLAQQTIVIRGNPNLQPAQSKAWSVGLVAQPKNLLKNFSFSLDYYNISVNGIVANNANAILLANALGQGPGFIPGNAATINPAAPFASQIRRSANGRLNNNGSYVALFPTITQRGAVLSDYLNIASRDVSGLEYYATYVWNTDDMGRFTFVAQANQFLTFTQGTGPGVPKKDFLGKFVSTVGDPISPGSIPEWKSNFTTQWSWKNIAASLTFNHINSYQDDPLFVMSPKMKAFYDAGTPKSDPAFAAYLADSTQLKVGGYREIKAFDTWDVQASYTIKSDNAYLGGITCTIGSTNVLDKLAPSAAGAFNDSYDTRTANNIGRFIYASLRKKF